MKQRIVFVNLHGNEFLVKTLNKIIFGQSVAIKHKYILDYLLNNNNYEVCSFINKRGLSLSYATKNPVLQSLRFLEHKIVMKKNAIPLNKVTVLKSENEIRHDDIVITYAYYGNQLEWEIVPDATRVICQMHFGTSNAELERQFQPHAMYNESDLRKYSGMWRRDLPWFKGQFITIPFIPAPRFKNIKPLRERKNKAVGVGTITYMHDITNYYGEPCAQPARRNCRELGKERPDLIDSYNFDYAEDQQGKTYKPTRNPIKKIYRRLQAKITGGHQKQYFSFDMVEKFNEYRIAVVGEEIMGIPGIGFVEAMACGCAFIGQNVGYYEDYGMKEGIHYIGYDGTKEGLSKTIEFWQRPENQNKLELIANNGLSFVKENFRGDEIVNHLLSEL